MTNDQLKEFVARQKRLTGIIQEASGLVQKLDMEHCAQTLQQLRQKISSDTFKIMVMGNFKTAKAHFINALPRPGNPAGLCQCRPPRLSMRSNMVKSRKRSCIF